MGAGRPRGDVGRVAHQSAPRPDVIRLHAVFEMQHGIIHGAQAFDGAFNPLRRLARLCGPAPKLAKNQLIFEGGRVHGRVRGPVLLPMRHHPKGCKITVQRSIEFAL